MDVLVEMVESADLDVPAFRAAMRKHYTLPHKRVGAYQKTLLMKACDARHTEYAQVIIDMFPDDDHLCLRDCEHETALTMAIRSRKTETVRLILSSAADPDAMLQMRVSNDLTVFMRAAWWGSIPTFREMFRHTTQPEKHMWETAEGRTVLTCAVFSGDSGKLDIILQHTSDPTKLIQMADIYGKTALMYAAEDGRHRCARVLLEACPSTLGQQYRNGYGNESGVVAEDMIKRDDVDTRAVFAEFRAQRCAHVKNALVK